MDSKDITECLQEADSYGVRSSIEGAGLKLGNQVYFLHLKKDCGQCKYKGWEADEMDVTYLCNNPRKIANEMCRIKSLEASTQGYDKSFRLPILKYN